MKILFDISPFEDIRSDALDPFQWHSFGPRPCFLLVPTCGIYPTGWICFTTSIQRKGVDFTAHLSIDTGKGFESGIEIPIPATRKGRVHHILKMPDKVRGILWFPMKGEGFITHGPVVMNTIGNFSRIIQMVTWVAHDLWKFRHSQQAARHGLSLSRLFFDIQGAYDSSAKLRFNFAPPSYASFVEEFDAPIEIDFQAMGDHLAELSCSSTFTMWGDFSGFKLEQVLETITAMQQQIYRNWRFIVFLSSDCDPAFLAVLQQECVNDPRLTIHLRNNDDSWSQLRKNAVKSMTGDFLIEVFVHDRLPPQALYHLAITLNAHPWLDIIYADEDCVSKTGKRHSPYFKSVWNPELFYSRNMLGHFVAYRRSLIQDVGGISSLDGAAGRLDLALRCVAQTPSDRIEHIPFVLCHRGEAAEWESGRSFSSDPDGANSLAVMQAHFASQPGVQVQPGRSWQTFRVCYPVPDIPPLVSILIPTRDAVEVLRKCIDSVQHRTDYPSWEIIVLDNQSSDPAALAYLSEITLDQRIRVVPYDQPFNYSAINNFGVSLARGTLICLLNNDVEAIEPHWLTEMVSHAVRPDVGAVGAKLLYSDGYVQHAGVVVGLGGLAGHVHRFIPGEHPGYAGLAQLTQVYSAVTAACMVVRLDVFLAVGGLDEVNLTVAYNDVDLCLRIRDAGFRNVWTPHAMLYHHESYSRGDDQDSAAKRVRFNAEKAYMLRRWRTDVTPDPFYNPNMTTDKEDYSIAHVPRVSKPWQPYLEHATKPRHWWNRAANA